MSIWSWVLVLSLSLIAGGALYVRLRWIRSPVAYKAMIAVAGCYFLAGVLVCAWVLHEFSRGTSQSRTEATTAPSSAASVASLAPSAIPSFAIGPGGILVQHYDPAAAARPDPKLTPGDVFADASDEDVCTPGWAKEHRHVTEDMKDKVYGEYGRKEGPGCCEVDHLIPLELGGSNDIKNLWPQPDDPRPGDGEKDQLENELHHLVCSGKMKLADAQKCIASDWVKCWETYVVPTYGPEWAEANRHGW
jgi:hypothetical protein